MSKLKIKHSDYQNLYRIYTEDEYCKGNITKTAQRFCRESGIPFDDSKRRRVSKILTKGGKPVIEKPHHHAKILLYDLETSPIIARVWSLWQNGINIDDIVRDWSLLCFSAKWLFDEKVMSFRLTEKELKTRDDSRIVKELWKLLDEADFIIAHNAERFDNKKSNARFLKYNLNLPSPYQTIDTLIHAKRKFSLTSNKLDYIAKYLGVEGKMITPTGMWRAVEEGDYSMLIKMDEYCQQDVLCLEQVYLKLRPYMSSHPNIGLFISDDIHSCPNCGSHDLDWSENKVYTTTSNQYEAFRCNSCGSLGRSKKAIKNNNKNLTVPNAR